MAWWVWALIGWSTLASAAVVWLAVVLEHLHDRADDEDEATASAAWSSSLE